MGVGSGSSQWEGASQKRREWPADKAWDVGSRKQAGRGGWRRRHPEKLIGGCGGGGGAWPATSGLQRPFFVSISAQRFGPKSRMETVVPVLGEREGNLLKNKSLRLFMNKCESDK